MTIATSGSCPGACTANKGELEDYAGQPDAEGRLSYAGYELRAFPRQYIEVTKAGADILDAQLMDETGLVQAGDGVQALAEAETVGKRCAGLMVTKKLVKR